MAILETEPPRAEGQPPSGGLFIPQIRAFNGLLPACQPWQQELLARHDFTEASRMAETILDLTQRLKDPTGSALTKGIMLGVLESEVSSLGDILKAHRGTWVIGADRRLPLASDAAGSALWEDYGVADERRPETRWFVIPGECVTAGQALTHRQTGSVYNPVIDLRIKTSADKPTLFCQAPNEVVEQESPGKWFRFSLAGTELHLLG